MDDERVMESENRALVEAITALHGVRLERVEFEDGDDVGEAHIATRPVGVAVESLKRILDEFRTQPERIRGTAQIGDIASFLAHTARFAAPARSAVFANPDRARPELLAVYDYSAAGAPAFHEHRARYLCPLSDEWKAWAARDGQQMAQADFAAFLEDRIGDVILADTAGEDSALHDFAALVGGLFATPQRLIEISRGLSVTAEQKVRQAVNLSTGEVQLAFEETHDAGQLKVPNLFVIAIPVFRSGPAYRIPVRLRYRLREGRLSWSYNLYRADKVFDHAFEEIVAKARESGLPVYGGAPEA